MSNAIAKESVCPSNVECRNVDEENVTKGSQRSKSAMCLVNEFIRSAKIKHQYQLLNESGPEHQRDYQVSLDLENVGSFTGHGTSIKKAQQDAANNALNSDRVQAMLASLKNGKKCKGLTKGSETPAVRLNVLAMKCGESATFTVTDLTTAIETERRISSRGRSTNRPASYTDFGPSYLACVNVCGHKFEGTGKTPQGARHSAAEKALHYCQANNLLTEVSSQSESSTLTASPMDEASSVQSKQNKSPLSILHDYAVANDLAMSFDILIESGSQHVPSFVTQCTLGDHKVEGTGTSKRLSKRNAAEKMLQLVQSLESLHLQDNPGTKDQSSVSGKVDPAAGDNDTGFSSLSSSSNDEDEVKGKKNDENDKQTHEEEDAPAQEEEEVFIEVRRGKRRGQQQENEMMKDQCLENKSNTYEETNEQIEGRSASSLSDNNTAYVSDEDDDDDEDKASTITTSTTVSKNGVSSAPDPVRRLDQYCASYKGAVPKYRVIYERYVNHKRREFVIQCTAKMPGPKGEVAYVVGIDSNTKLAKKRAAENMLRLLTTGKPLDEIAIPARSKLAPILKDTTHSANQNTNGADEERPPRPRRQRQVSFSDSNPRNHKRGKKDN